MNAPLLPEAQKAQATTVNITPDIDTKLRAATTAVAHTAPPSALHILVALEGDAFRAIDRLGVQHQAVNKPRKLLDVGHIFWVGRAGYTPHIKAISSQAVVDKTTPFIQWLTTVLTAHFKAGVFDAPHSFTFNSRRESDDFDYPFSHGFFAPFAPNPHAGGLLFTCETAFSDANIKIMERLGQVYGTSHAALGHTKRAKMTPRKKTLFLSILAVMTLSAFIPVPMTELAPAEIVADDPFIVTAPIDGVMDGLLIPPNTLVNKDTVLARLNDTSYRNEYEVADQEKRVSEARFRQASLSAFIDEAAKKDLAIANAERDLAEARKAYAKDRLGKTELRAPRAGLAIYSDPKDWTGRPVSTGEAIIEIADPTRVLLRLHAPLASGESLREGARVRLFLDADPVNPLEAILERASFYAEEKPGGKMAYTAYARLTAEDVLPRIGARGVAKIYGETAPLGYWLFRRPLTALRQFLGI